MDTLGQLSPAEFSAIGGGANPPQVALQLFLKNPRFAIDKDGVKRGVCVAFAVSGDTHGSEGTSE